MYFYINKQIPVSKVWKARFNYGNQQLQCVQVYSVNDNMIVSHDETINLPCI